MKIISGLLRLNKLVSPGSRIAFAAIAIAILAVSICFTGCSKSKPPETQAVAVQDTNQVVDNQNHAPVYQPPAAVAPAAADPASGAPDLNAMDRVLMHWVMANRRVPKNFNDFAATAGVAIPPPPAGKQYIIDKTMHIKLVNQ